MLKITDFIQNEAQECRRRAAGARKTTVNFGCSWRSVGNGCCGGTTVLKSKASDHYGPASRHYKNDLPSGGLLSSVPQSI
jgi:hypothetical protein